MLFETPVYYISWVGVGGSYCVGVKGFVRREGCEKYYIIVYYNIL